TSSSRISFWMSMKSGISFRQGGHQVAQTLSTITWPSCSDKVKGSPFMLSRVKSGAFLSSCSPAEELEDTPACAGVDSGWKPDLSSEQAVNNRITVIINGKKAVVRIVE